MGIAEIRQQLHKYIDLADEKKLEAIYTILQPALQYEKFSDDDLKKFYERREKYISGKSETYTVEEARNIIQQAKKEK